jgi:hypothetical protein
MEFIAWVETRLEGRTLEVREVAKLVVECDDAGLDVETQW